MNKALPSLVWLTSALVIGLSGPQAAAEQPIRIGTSLSITGKQYSAQGGFCREGYMLCQNHVNAERGMMGRQIKFVIYDDASDGKAAARNYEKLITEDKVDAVLGPYGSEITEAVSDVIEKHRMLMIAPTAGSSAIWEKGRRYLVMMLSPVESVPEGLLDLAARNGLRRVAVIKLDGLVANAASKGAAELAKKMGLELVFAESYPNGTSDFSSILKKVKAVAPDVLMAASVRIEDLVAINRQAREVDRGHPASASARRRGRRGRRSRRGAAGPAPPGSPPARARRRAPARGASAPADRRTPAVEPGTRRSSNSPCARLPVEPGHS